MKLVIEGTPEEIAEFLRNTRESTATPYPVPFTPAVAPPPPPPIPPSAPGSIWQDPHQRLKEQIRPTLDNQRPTPRQLQEIQDFLRPGRPKIRFDGVVANPMHSLDGVGLSVGIAQVSRDAFTQAVLAAARSIEGAYVTSVDADLVGSLRRLKRATDKWEPVLALGLDQAISHDAPSAYDTQSPAAPRGQEVSCFEVGGPRSNGPV